MYASQEWPENFSRGAAPRSGRAAAQRNERGRVLKAHASEKRHRRNAQRVGAWARLETDKISRSKPSRSIELLHRRRLQCEAILESPRIPDENAGSEPGLRAHDSSFLSLWHLCRGKFTRRKTILLSVAFANGDGKLNCTGFSAESIVEIGSHP